MEPLVPFSKIGEADTLTEAYKIYSEISRVNKESAFIVFDEETNVLIIDGRNLIYESPDGGKTIYSRRLGIYSTKELVQI